MSPPTGTSPLSVNVSDFVGICGGSAGESAEMSGLAESVLPFAFDATVASELCARNGNDINGDGSASYEVSDEIVRFTRTDVPAGPNEEVNVRVRLQYRFTATGDLNAGTGNNGDMAFNYSLQFYGGSWNSSAIAQVINFYPSMTIDTGWVTTNSGWVNVALDEDLPTYLRVESRFLNNLDTCASCGGPHYMSTSATMEWRFMPVPFEFQGPGTYSADSENLLIEDNNWPSSTVAVEASTWSNIKSYYQE
jgi:hypothetical protein